MSIAHGVEQLWSLVAQLQGEAVAATAPRLLRGLGELERDAHSAGEADLAMLCASVGETLDGLLGTPELVDRADALRRQLEEVVAYAAQRAGLDATRFVDDTQQLVEAVGMFVDHARGVLGELEHELLAIEAAPQEAGESQQAVRRIVHTLKAEFGALQQDDAQQLCHLAESAIDACAERGQPFPTDGLLTLLDRLRRFIERLADDVHSSFEGADEARAELEQLLHAAAATAAGVVGSAASRVAPTTPNDLAGERADAKPARVAGSVKVGTARLDQLVDMVGELVVAQSMVLQAPEVRRVCDQELTRRISQVSKITRDLQEAAMSMRMVPVRSMFQKMARLVRDVASRSGRRVQLVLEGEDTELDRNVVEQVADPLMHLVRNAIVHGIEPVAERAAVGKPKVGTLTLRALHQNGAIVIEIRDDGRGIDRQRVVERAVERGLLAGDVDPASLSDADVQQLLFQPGLSTSVEVTDLSGRGVGMDVVRRNVEALRGKVEVESAPGDGATFRLRLPLTLAIIDGMVVRVGASRYVIPTLSIEQSFQPVAGDVHYVVDRGECVHVRGAVLPVHRLAQIFEQEPDGAGVALDRGILVVVESEGRRSCLFVDEILGQQQVVIKSLGLSRARCQGLSGGAIMTDGRVALIVDVDSLIETAVMA